MASSEEQLERLAAQLGRDAAADIDPDSTAEAVVTRLKTEPVRVVWWRRAGTLQTVAAAVIVLAVALGIREVAGPSSSEPQDFFVLMELEELAEAELAEVLDSLEYEAPVSELVPAGLSGLSEAELDELLVSMEG
ncbi:MAG: hypothetical protein ACE5JM_13585 [Armatimonadota bacterium]